jgi:transposase
VAEASGQGRQGKRPRRAVVTGLTTPPADYLLPPSVDDWLNQDQLARFIVEVIDQLDLSKLTREYAGRGSKAYHPATLLGILVYGYATGIFSSQKRRYS